MLRGRPDAANAGWLEHDRDERGASSGPRSRDGGRNGGPVANAPRKASLWGIHLTGLECGGGGRGWQALSQVAWRVPGVVSE